MSTGDEQPVFSLTPATPWRASDWLARHSQAALYALGRLVASGGATIMTALVIGVALALPAALYVGLENVRETTVSRGDSAFEVSLHLVPEVSSDRVREMVSELDARSDVLRVTIVSREEALAEYRRLTGFDAVLDLFEGENPFGPVLVVSPVDGDLERLHQFSAQWARVADVEASRFDLEWVQRLDAIIDAVERGVVVLSGFLLVGVLLVVGNTIRLSVENQREEIAVIRLFGATDAFVRRPFLYSGAWHGLVGGLLAWVAVETAAATLSGPVLEVARLYRNEFRLEGLGGQGVWLVVVGAGLGLLGAWLAVSRQLARMT